jgi:glucosamine--fructose-6-phosphate aminotransferase (isomerizing)
MLTRASGIASQVLSTKSVEHIRKLAVVLKDRQHIYCLGRGISFPISLEAALKIKEISYIHAEGLATGELKHGTLALIEQGTPCLVFLPNDETYSANLAGAMEVKARGGYIVGISFQPNDVFDYYIEVADVQEATIIPNVVVAQLLAYYVSVEKGLDPDMPRNLAKSVTVR